MNSSQRTTIDDHPPPSAVGVGQRLMGAFRKSKHSHPLLPRSLRYPAEMFFSKNRVSRVEFSCNLWGGAE
jgi:hypothetical protein